MKFEVLQANALESGLCSLLFQNAVVLSYLIKTNHFKIMKYPPPQKNILLLKKIK